MRACLSLWFLVAASVVAADVREHHYTHGEWKAIITHEEKPEYPFEARRAHLAGEGRFRVCIAPDGRVTAVKILKSTGHQLLDSAATKAFSRWRAKPGPRREIDMPISFMLSPGPYPPPTPAHPPDTVVREFTR